MGHVAVPASRRRTDAGEAPPFEARETASNKVEFYECGSSLVRRIESRKVVIYIRANCLLGSSSSQELQVIPAIG